MAKDIKKDVIKIFKTSNSSDELFDTFRTVIDQKIKDEDLYKTLLWNKALSTDERLMFTEKICKEIPEFCFKIYLALGEILESTSFYGKNKEKAFQYAKKAADYNKSSNEPYLFAAEMYNAEFNLPAFDSLVEFIDEGIKQVKNKDKLYFALSALYRKQKNYEKEKYYQKKGEDFQKRKDN